MFQSIKNKVLLFFSIFTGISIIIVALNLRQVNLTKQTIKLNNQIDSIHIAFLDVFSCFDDFFAIELINTKYYASNKSVYISKKDSLTKVLKYHLESKQKNKFAGEEYLHATINLTRKIDSLNSLFNKINHLILERGFKDYGKEGKMRNWIHLAEQNPYSNLVTILSLRRSEKDYIIRNELKYAKNLNNLTDKYLLELEKSGNIPQYERDTLQSQISAYRKSFNELVEIDKKLGIKDFSGLRKKFKQNEDQILHEFLLLKENINNKSKTRLAYYKFFYLLLTCIIIGFSIILSYFISRIMTKRITKLSVYINDFVSSNYKINRDLEVKHFDDEIGVLISNFEKMKQNLSIHINKLEEMVHNRTRQIKKQNNDILSSIGYAQRIQEALLPDKNDFKTYFPESLIYYKPRSIVSGDFYWFKRFNDKNISVIAVADCTGHGVPGAMMSMLGIAFLNEIVARESVKSAGEILTALKIQVTEHLNNRQNTFITDGMDIAILVFFHENGIVQFAGAKRDVLFFRNNELTILNGDKESIGRSYSGFIKFENHQFKVIDKDIFYLLTDGFQDQIGAESKRTMQKNKAYQFINELKGLSFPKQSDRIDKFIESWKKEEPQTDDILILGFSYDSKNFIQHAEKKQIYEKLNVNV